MAFFPNSIMPKGLVPETQNEVDNSPSIFNARDFNTHDREIVAIEKFLGVTGSTIGVLPALTQALITFKNITTNGLLTRYCGILYSGGKIPLPQNIPNTTSLTGSPSGTLNVGSTTGFPTSGYITIFNSMLPSPSDFSFGQSKTNQEIASYTGLTATSFTGVIRTVEGTMETLSVPQLVLSGRASLMLSHANWDTAGTVLSQMIIGHDQLLNVSASFLNQVSAVVGFSGFSGTVGTTGYPQAIIEYALTVSASFNAVQFVSE